MAGFDRYFQDSPEAATNPKVRFWQGMKNKKGVRLACELIRERDVLSFGPASLYVHFLDERDEDVQTPDEVDWSSRLNDELLRLQVRAMTPENEVKRFALVLRDRLEEPEIRFGDGYFNAVLNEYVEKSPFAGDPSIQEKRRFITEHRASRDGRSFSECWEAIEAVIVHCARDLTALGYDRQQAVQILSAALATYLDERFSITSRQLLGFA